MTRPLGLAFRLQRGALLGWTVALFFMGYIYGSIANDIQQMLDENPLMEEMFRRSGAASLTDAFFAEGILQLALMASGFAIASTLRLISEESAGRAEPILAGPTRRTTWAFSHLAIAVVGTLVTVTAAGLGLGISYAIIVNDAGQVPRLVGAALVSTPAVLVLVGIAIALFGALPAAARWAWAALGVVVIVGAFGEILQLPQWTRRVSPFEHVPGVPAEDLAVLPIVVLTLIAGALVGYGLWSLSRRDLRTE
jgi:ABC-2 type transport system permease protein